MKGKRLKHYCQKIRIRHDWAAERFTVFARRRDLRTELDPYGWHMEIWVRAALMARVSPESL